MSNQSSPQSATPQPIQLPDFWENRYQEGTARWDLGQPAPPFVTLLESNHPPAPGRIAVLGAGRGQDALLFAARGFDVVGFDFAPSAIADANQLAEQQGLKAQFLQRDIFKLSPEFDGAFDFVLEHTCFCAIDPALRNEYVQVVKRLLRPGGELIALFWAHDRPGGPPFGTSLAELESRFLPDFERIAIDRPTNSVEGRRNEEYLMRLRVK